MARNSSGTYSLPSSFNPVITGTVIESAWANTTLSDVASALTDSLDRSGRGGMLQPLKLVAGTVAAPGLCFDVATTTGLSRPSATEMSFSIAATEIFRLATTAVSSLQPLRLPDGAVGSPSCSFTNDTGMGLYRIGANILGIATAGVERARFDASGNFGVNTSSFAFAAANRSSFEINGTTDSTVVLKNANDPAGYLQGSASSLSIGALGATRLISVILNGAERARFGTAGTFSINTTSAAAILNVGGQTASNRQASFTTGISDSAFFVGIENGVSGSGADTLQGRFGLFYSGTGESAVLDFRRGAGSQDGIIAFRTNATERMRITGSGTVGIGVASPDTPLHVTASGVSGGLSLSGTSNASYLLMGNKDSGGAAGPVVFSVANRTLTIGRGNSFTGIGTQTQDLVIDASGNVGVGTGTITDRLTVQGALAFNLNSTTDVLKAFTGGAGLAYFGSTTSTALALITSGGERMRIDASGNMRVGNGGAFTARLSVITTAGQVGDAVDYSNTAITAKVGVPTDVVATRHALFLQSYTASNTNHANTGIGFTQNNNVGARAAGIYLTSDAALAFRVDGNGAVNDSSLIGTERMRITSDGRFYGTALHNNGGSVTGTTNQYVASGTYTPTLTAITNIGTLSVQKFQWLRVGNLVTVSGQFVGTPTVAATATQVGISLPIASNLNSAGDCAGTGRQGTNANGEVLAIYGDVTNDRAECFFQSLSNVAVSYVVQFTYEVR